MNASLRWAIAFIAILLAGQGFCTSAMGVCAGSVQQDKSTVGTVHDGYTVEEIRYGTAVMRMYVAPTGVVFGVDWKGMIHPAVTQLLGSSAGAHPENVPRTAGQTKESKGGAETEDIIVRKWGQPGDPHGRAYAPDLAPQGVKVDQMWLEWPAA